MKSYKTIVSLFLCILIAIIGPMSVFADVDLADVISDGSVDSSIVVDNTTIDVEGTPYGAEVLANEVDKTQEADNLVDNSTEFLFAYDISIEDKYGEEWQPTEDKPVTVTVNTDALTDGQTITILHEHNGVIEPIEGKYVVENNQITFKTNGFSKFYFFVTFTYGDLQYVMSGNGEAYLSDLLQSIGIPRTVEEVVDVDFSNPDYLTIIDEGTDWRIESTAPFATTETLTIYFYDGKVYEIVVTDPVIYNYAVGSDITNVPLLKTGNYKIGTVTDGDKYASGLTFKMNTTDITEVDIINNAATTVPAASDAPTMIFFVEPNTAIRMPSGTEWFYDGKDNDTRPPEHTASDSIWYWCWDGTYNYAIFKEGTAGKYAEFIFMEKNATSTDGKKVASTSKPYYCKVAFVVVDNSKPTLLADKLPEINEELNSNYTIKNVPATLFNYEGDVFNKYYDAKGPNYLAFISTTKGKDVTAGLKNLSWRTSDTAANGGGGHALQGIVKPDLSNGLPVLSQGQQVDIFSPTSNSSIGKTVYSDVDFEFVYNEDTGYYTYNSSLNHAQYVSSENKIKLYDQSLSIADTFLSSQHGSAGFYPFEDINKAYTNAHYNEMSSNDWALNLEKNAFSNIPSEYATDIVASSSTSPASTADMHFGLHLESDFYLPTDKKLNGQNMIYEFTGDDDLWVFIDGKLVLDIGGGHTYVSGSFDLTTGKVTVEKYSQLDAASGGYYNTAVSKETNLSYTDKFIEGLQADQMHKIQVFYLERHAGVSNCKMRFNLPLVPSNAVNVSKNLKNHEGEELSITPNTEYTFKMYTAEDNDDSVDATDFSVEANLAYTVRGAGAPTDTQYTNKDGEFNLKDGWIATFKEIPRFTEVYVVEKTPTDEYIYSGSTVSINQGEVNDYYFGHKTDTKVMQLNKSINFDFINYMETQPLTIKKNVVGGTAGLIKSYLDPSSLQKFTFELDFIPEILEVGKDKIEAFDETNEVVKLTDNDKFDLCHGESVTIPRVPVNMTFKLSESNPDSAYNSFDNPVINATNCTSTADELITVYDFDTPYEWMIGDYGPNTLNVTNQQRFDLTISKSGISILDHYDKLTDLDKEKSQSTMYRVVGKRGDETIVDMNVAIHGNDSTTIKGLPVGEYTVTELTDWSWRYEPTDGVTTKSVVINENAKASVEYENERIIDNWLSGDSYAENWWGGGLLNKIMNLANSASGDN